MKPDRILLDRLLHLYDPFQALFNNEFFFRPAPEEYDSVDPVPPPQGRKRTTSRMIMSLQEELGRVRYFCELALQGRRLAPIELDNEWSSFSPTGLVIPDGHHRVCGAVLAGERSILCRYSGSVAVLHWLQGQGCLEDPPF